MDPLLSRADRRRRACQLPPQLRRKAVSVAELTLGLLFPELADDPRPESAALESAALREILREVVPPDIAEAFLAGLPALGVALDEDAAALEAFDPAATCLVEVVAGYPGFLAVAHYRVAHALHAHAPLLA
nr:hypothetical protein [Deltaproteobacteria bacterium]